MAVSQESLSKARLELNNAEAALKNANNAFKPTKTRPQGLKPGDPQYNQARRIQQDAQKRLASAKSKLSALERSEKELTAAQRLAEQAKQVPTATKKTTTTKKPKPTPTPKPTSATTSTPKPSPDKADEGKPKTKDELYADALETANKLYNMPDIIFKSVPSLNELLQKYVNGGLTDAQFKRELQNDPWYRQNSTEIKARYVQLFNYEDLVKQGRAQGTTDYEQQIARITRNIQAKARQLRGVELDEANAKLIAQDLYIFNLDDDDAVIVERLARFITPTAGMIGGKPTTGYGGEALQNYQTLQAIARANGFKLEDILPRDAMGKPMSAESTLQALATNKLDINRVAQDARKLAAQGQPQYVRELLGQGFDLEQVYQPYKGRMAAVLEVDPMTINLNDPALRGAITEKGDINLYDFDRLLRKDSRWQYTQQARSETADAVFQVLRDFGFMG